MGALGHYLEREGLPTTQISLVREHTVALAPPRALWVSFMLGRPFGVPGDAGFQRRVLRAALELLELPGPGPVLQDFPEDAPYEDLGAAPQGLVCPVSFPSAHVPGQLPLAGAFTNEARQLQAWHELAVAHRGRTALGVTGLGIEELVAFVAAWTGEAPPRPFAPGMSASDALKLACDEVKAYYYEAKAMQPGRHASDAIQNWFWMDTAAGRVFLLLRDKAAASGDPSMQRLASLSLVPRAVEATLKARAGTH